MTLLVVIVAPLVLGLIAFATPSPVLRAWLVPLGAIVHAAATAVVVATPTAPIWNGWLALDPLSRVFLGFLSLQYLICSLYVPAYLAARAERSGRLFCGALLVLLGAMTLCVLAHHFILMWVAIELTTLSAAPLVYFTRNLRSLEATWKYLLIGSVGIALALFGSFALAYSALHGGLGATLMLDDLLAGARHGQLSPPWLHSAFVMLLVGYGTKMGLAPMHTWKPDAYGEAPGIASALLAGGVTSCAFLAILRVVQICFAAGDGAFAQEQLLLLGVVSMSVGAVFMVRQRDYKRMLAYSSVEHMGILAIGIGIGGRAMYGSLLHLIANGLGKSAMFLAAGNIHRAYGSKSTDDVTGVLRRMPASGTVFLLGFFAITAAPPSALFISELAIVDGAFAAGYYVVGALFLAILAVVFLGMATVVVRMVQGTPPEVEGFRVGEEPLTVVPAVLFLILVIALGVYIPPEIALALDDAVAYLGAGP